MSVEAKRGPPPPVPHFSAGEAVAETMRLLNLLPFLLLLAIRVNVLLVSLTSTSYLFFFVLVMNFTPKEHNF